MLPSEKNRRRILTPFTGVTWQELEDIYPRALRVDSLAHRILGVIWPAIYVTRKWYWKEFPQDRQMKLYREVAITIEDLLLLLWMQRCEESRANVGIDPLQVGNPLKWNSRTQNNKKSALHRFGLIEVYPVRGVRIFRLTAKGKLVVRRCAENLESADRNLVDFIAAQPEEYNQRITSRLERFGLGIDAVVKAEAQPKEENEWYAK